jgi:hypothetical protein
MVYGAAMADVRIEHTYDCSVDTFWNEIFFTEEYNRRLFKEALGFPVWELKKNEDKGERVERIVDVVPKLADLPAPIKKVVGENVGYREEGVFDKQARRYRINIVPNKLGDKLTVKGELWVEPVGEGKCKRIFDAVVSAKIFGIGGMIEKRLITDMQESYAAGARFTNKYIAEKGLK